MDRAVTGSPVWPHPMRWADLPGDGAEIALTSDAGARSRIATFLEVEAITRLCAWLTLRPWLDGVEIKGRIEATVARICGVSLEPFEETIDEPIVFRVVPSGSPHAPITPTGDVELELSADDLPDVAGGEGFDLGAYVIEHLALALDPFPRKPGAVFEFPAPTRSISPFGVLARLKTRSSEECGE